MNKRLLQFGVVVLVIVGAFMPPFGKTKTADAAAVGVPMYVLNLQTGLVGWWTFDGNSLVKNVADFSGNNNNGQLATSSTATTTVPGRFGQALSFNGTSNYIYIPDSTSLHPTNLTICAWVNFNDVSVNHVVVDKPQNGPVWANPYLSFMVRYNGASSPKKWELDLGNSSGYSGGTSVWNDTLNTNSWYFVCMTYDGSQISAYRDGASLGAPVSFAGPINYTNSPVLIGADYGGSPVAEFMNGKIDDVRIYNRTLSASEIAQLYALGANPKTDVTLPGPANLTSGLVGLWTMDGPYTTGTTTASDTSGSNFTGSTVNWNTVGTTSTWITGGAGTWKAPNGITAVKVELWGGGGGGGAASSTRGAGAGGAGGGYARANALAVVPGTTYNFYIGKGGAGGAITGATSTTPKWGNAGENSMFLSSSTVLANSGVGGGGGASGTAGSPPNSSGTTGEIGEAVFAGGAGGKGTGGSGGNSGSGGGAAGDANNGTAGSGTTGGAGGSAGGGTGANGTGTVGSAGSNGGSPGAGGSGGFGSNAGTATFAGGNGAAGQMKMTGYYYGSYWTQGKLGQAALLNGYNAYINVGAANSGVQTLSFWFKASTSTTQGVIDLNGTQTVTISANTVNANSWSGATKYVDGVAGSTVSDTNWHLITITNSAGINASAMTIGKVASNFCGCTLDDVRIYKRALSATEVAQLYSYYTSNTRSTTVVGPNNLGTATGSSGLVAWYTFDGPDSLKNFSNRVSGSFAGSLQGFANNSTSTAPGKFGQAYLFGGTSTNVYINIGTGPSSVQTVSFWAKESTTTNQSFMALNGTATITANAGGTVSAGAGFSSPTIYVDGAVSSTIDKGWHQITITTATPVNASAFTVGKSGSNTCGCTIDDVRLFSRALSSTEVSSLYQLSL